MSYNLCAALVEWSRTFPLRFTLSFVVFLYFCMPVVLLALAKASLSCFCVVNVVCAMLHVCSGDHHAPVDPRSPSA